MGSWVDAQRKAGIAKTIERQRTHAHQEGRMLLSNQRRPEDRVYTLECTDCGAIIARYVFRRHLGRWDLVVSWHYTDVPPTRRGKHA